jgi:DNA polymerase-4
MDMDAFFASVEQLDDPALRGRCLVVGGSHRGVVAAASYEARKFGIHSAMPIFQARLKCPHLVIVAPRRRRYAELSGRIMDILRTFSPLVEPISIDEAYVDISGCQRLHGTAHETGLAVKTRIREQTGLTSSVGIAPNKFLAKIASDFNKPDGLTIITPEQMPLFIETLAIEKVPGVGAQTRQRLTGMGIQTLGQILQWPEQQLVRNLGKFGYRLLALAQGRDNTPVECESEAKSVSSETTLAQDTADRAVLAACLLAQSDTVARQLRAQHLRARTITLKLKTTDFVQHTRSHSWPQPIQSSDTIYQAALRLLTAFALTQPIRLIGVGAGNLMPESMPVQQALFADEQVRYRQQWEQLDRALDAISERYGQGSVVRGTLAKTGRNDKKQ